MAKYRSDFLYLVSDESSRKYAPRAQKGSLKSYEVSKLYNGEKYLNDGMMNSGKNVKVSVASQRIL